MSYDAALNKAWEDLAKLNPVTNSAFSNTGTKICNGVNPDKTLSLKFLGDTYTVSLQDKKVISLSCNIAAKDFTAILILHYLVQKLKGLPKLSDEWVTFKESSGLEGYYPAFRQRAIAPIIRKYGGNPEGLLSVLDRLPAKRVNQGDIGIILEAFAGVPTLITLWRGDEEFGPEANLLFDKNITKIFCTEDIVVLAGMVAAGI